MILTAHQPVYLPWLGLFHKITLAESYCYWDDVQYQVDDFNNRNKIKGPNGSFWLTVPVKTKNHFQTKLRDAVIVDGDHWRRKHWKSLLTCYRRAPYFPCFADFFEDVYKRDWRYLSELNEHILKFFLEVLGIRVAYYKMSDLEIQGRKSDLVLDVCLKLGASTFVFGAHGRNYADVSKFAARGVRVCFQDYHHPQYPQLHGGFEPNLSIVDLLFNCGPASKEVLMSGNITREQMIAS